MSSDEDKNDKKSGTRKQSSGISDNTEDKKEKIPATSIFIPLSDITINWKIYFNLFLVSILKNLTISNLFFNNRIFTVLLLSLERRIFN